MTTRRAASADETPNGPRSGHPGGSPSDHDAVPSSDPEPTKRGPVDLSGLSVAGITRRRAGLAAGALLGIWIIAVFARQVCDATAAANRAVQIAADNAALAAEVESLQKEVQQIVRPEVVSIAARGERLGDAREIPFTLDPSVPAPVDGAPGSASVRLGASIDRQTPLESWLSLLFGPAD